jgi:hypothetical protein
MDFPQKVLNGVLELPLLRNAQKRHKKTQQKTQRKERHLLTSFGGYLADIRRFQQTTNSFLSPCAVGNSGSSGSRGA